MGASIGQGPGGSSVLYGAALGRLRRVDFVEDDRETLADGTPALPNAWPIDYDVFRAYYRQAEDSMRVVGERDPLDPDDDAELATPPPLTAQDAAIHQGLERAGLHPYRLHAGIDYLPGCTECQGHRCRRGCKADGYSRGLTRALASGRVSLRTGSVVTTVARAGGRMAVTTRSPDGATQTWTGRRAVLAAGALNTPLILARSAGLWGTAGPPPLLGRGLMFHISDIFAVLTGKKAGPGPRKTLSFRDLYRPDGAGLGEVQSVGTTLTTGLVMSYLRTVTLGLGRIGAAAEFLRPLAWAVALLVGTAPIFATILQDLPYEANRVWEEAAEPAGRSAPPRRRIALSYTPGAALHQRSRALRRRLAPIFAPHRLVFLSPAVTPNWGHPMGTCRMGADPRTSVVDPDGRLWGQDDLYVADASVFPSSGGTGPSLTVIALALRLGDHLAQQVPARRAAPRRIPARARPGSPAGGATPGPAPGGLIAADPFPAAAAKSCIAPADRHWWGCGFGDGGARLLRGCRHGLRCWWRAAPGSSAAMPARPWRRRASFRSSMTISPPVTPPSPAGDR